MNLVILAHVPTHAITEGFLPAARRLGLNVTLVTDKPELDHHHPTVYGCNVFNPVEVIDCLHRHGVRPHAVFSNSDHLQTQTAMVGQFFGVPHKPVQACYLAKHKGEMRRHLREGMRHVLLNELADLEQELPFPCVAKPCKGVASMDVIYLADREALRAFAPGFWERNPGLPLLVEEYLSGPIHSIETLGLHYLGGFTCTLSELPYFIETGARWGLKGVSALDVQYVLEALQRLGATFGACHTEFVMTDKGPRIIEVNYRSIGDQSDFQLDRLLGGRYFELVLRAQLGEELEIPPIDPTWHSVVEYLFAREAGELASLPPAHKRELEGCSVSYTPVKKPGDVIAPQHSNRDYLAMLHVTGPGVDRVERLAREEARHVEDQIAWR